MNRSDVQAWLDRYVTAWQANGREPIEALFTDDAVYRFRPWGATSERRGRAAIAESWLEDPDQPGTWEASYEPFAVDGNRAVATGTSRYQATSEQGAKLYHNVFLLEFADDARCSAFTELFMLEK